jgi:PAS domain S-box-containing protein
MRENKIEILLIEDNLSEAALIQEMLSDARRLEFSVQHVRYLSEGLRLLQERQFDVAIVDLGLPDSQGLETVLTVRRHSRQTPVVALTVLDDEEAALKSLQMDIQDYLVKGEINGCLLSRAIRYAMQRKRDLESIRESEDRFTAFMLHMPTAAWMKDLQGRYVYVNTEAERIVSSSSSRLLGKTAAELFPLELARQFSENDERVLSEGGELRTTEVFRQENGLERRFTICRFTVPGPDGQPAYIAGIALDITDTMRAEEEIQRLADDLAKTAAELALANQDLEAFNYTVAHDLRQPLNSINGCCQAIEMLWGDQIPAECLEYVKKAHGAVLRMDGLIGSLLDFSRISWVEPHRETVDLSALAHETAKELKLAEPGREVEFRIAVGIVADADASLLRIVLDNLIGNAWKYSGAREKAVIEFNVTDIDGKPVYFVRDNGSGFEKADADTLFVPFRRLPGAREFRGVGIGLATVDRIIRRHGGRVWAEGEPDKGATFFFALATK